MRLPIDNAILLLLTTESCNSLDLALDLRNPDTE